jgi:hypothetical protein
MARWNGNSLIVNNVVIAKLVPAKPLSGSPRYCVQWEAATSAPCTFDAARKLAETIARVGIAPARKTA